MSRVIEALVQQLSQPAARGQLIARYEQLAAQTTDDVARQAILGLIQGLRQGPAFLQPLVEQVVDRIGAPGVPVLDGFTYPTTRAAVRSAVSRYGDWCEGEPLASVRGRISHALGTLTAGGTPDGSAQLAAALEALQREVAGGDGVTASKPAEDGAPSPVDVTEADFAKYRISPGWYETRFAEDLLHALQITTDQYTAFCAAFNARDRVYARTSRALWPGDAD